MSTSSYSLISPPVFKNIPVMDSELVCRILGTKQVLNPLLTCFWNRASWVAVDLMFVSGCIRAQIVVCQPSAVFHRALYMHVTKEEKSHH